MWTPFKEIDLVNRLEIDKNKLVFIAKDGWPVEGIIGRPIKTIIRRLIHTKKIEKYGTYYKRTKREINFN